jgi:aminomethyltransferase
MKNTVLSSVHLRQGAKMGEFQGWNLPLQFSDLEDEHHAVRHAAGLFDVSFLGRIELAGAGAESLLQRLFTRDVTTLGDGHAIYGLFCNDKGGILDASLVMKLPAGKNGDRFFVTTNAAATDGVLSWIRKDAGKNVNIVDQTTQIAQFALQGPFADAVLEQCAGHKRRKLKQKQLKEIEILEIDTLVARTGYTGERGYELFVPADKAVSLWQGILEQGRALGLLPCGATCRDILRIEAAYVQYGADITEERTPIEAGLMTVVDLHKDFVGKEAILKQKQDGQKEHIVGFELYDKGLPKTGATIYSENREIGTVTSSNHSYSRRRDVGLGYVLTRYALPGQEIEIELKDREIAAKVVEMPFYKRK